MGSKEPDKTIIAAPKPFPARTQIVLKKKFSDMPFPIVIPAIIAAGTKLAATPTGESIKNWVGNLLTKNSPDKKEQKAKANVVNAINNLKNAVGVTSGNTGIGTPLVTEKDLVFFKPLTPVVNKVRSDNTFSTGQTSTPLSNGVANVLNDFSNAFKSTQQIQAERAGVSALSQGTGVTNFISGNWPLVLAAVVFAYFDPFKMFKGATRRRRSTGSAAARMAKARRAKAAKRKR
jgi:hypothetical protein